MRSRRAAWLHTKSREVGRRYPLCPHTWGDDGVTTALRGHDGLLAGDELDDLTPESAPRASWVTGQITLSRVNWLPGLNLRPTKSVL